MLARVLVVSMAVSGFAWAQSDTCATPTGSTETKPMPGGSSSGSGGSRGSGRNGGKSGGTAGGVTSSKTMGTTRAASTSPTVKMQGKGVILMKSTSNGR